MRRRYPRNAHRRLPSRPVAAASAIVCALSLTLASSPVGAITVTTHQLSLPAYDEPLAVQGVSCASSTDCVAVGYSTSVSGAHVPIVESFDGTNWSVSVPISPSSPPDEAPQAVSCADAADCVAVGQTYAAGNLSGAFALVLSSGSWTQSALPLPQSFQQSSINSISCFDISHCTAVGTVVDSGGNYFPLVETYDASSGTPWTESVPATPTVDTGGNPESYNEGQLTSVSCVSATQCTAVGLDVDSGYVTHAMAGGSPGWAFAQVPDVTGATFQTLSSVSCVDTTHCEATGNYQTDTTDTGTVAATLASGTWSVARITNPDSSTTLSNLLIHCASTGNCVAVGDATQYTGDSYANLWGIATEVAGTWTSIDVAPADPTQLIALQVEGLSCDGSEDCVAVGWDQGSPNAFALTVPQSGTPAAVILPGYSPPPIASMNSVSCISPSRCVGVGTFLRDRALPSPIMGVFSGASWSVTTGADLPNETSQLLSVSCVTASFCVGVGQDIAARFESPLVAIYKNGTWIAKALHAGPWGSAQSHLASVSCKSISFCVALGTIDRPSGADPVIAATFNGASLTSWTRTVVAAGGLGHRPQVSVSCASTVHCVGTASAQSGRATLVESLVGKLWHTSVLPQGKTEPVLFIDTISCGDGAHCVAGGHTASRPVVDQLAGALWTQVPLSRNSAGAPATVTGVSCRTALVCRAVGTYNQFGATGSFVARGVSGRWNVQASPNLSAQPNATTVLSSISCPTVSSCLAVGYSASGTTQLPLYVPL
jgi:hypothetical protein